MSLANNSAPLTLGDPGSLLRPIFILIGSAARDVVESENRKVTATIKLIQLKRKAVFFMTYLLLLKSKADLENTRGLI
jgi:hypothetical protein